MKASWRGRAPVLGNEDPVHLVLHARHHVGRLGSLCGAVKTDRAPVRRDDLALLRGDWLVIDRRLDEAAVGTQFDELN